MKTGKQDLKGLAENLVTFGIKKGADEVEVTVGQGFEFSVKVRMKEIETLTEAGSKGLSLKVIKDKKVATASSEDFSEETLANLMTNAIKRAELGNPDEFAGLPEKQEMKIDVASLNLHDPKIAELSADQKIKLALDTEKIALSDKRINNSEGARFGSYEFKNILVNSKGFSGEYDSTSCSIDVALQAGETNAKVEGFWFSSKRHFKELESPEKIAKKAVERTVRQLGAKKIETQNVPVVVEPFMTSGILEFLFECVAGTSIYRKASLFVDKLGQKIADERVTIIDDALMPGKFGSRPFDSEGVPTQTTPVIESGVLKNYLCNTYAARKLNMKSTGNCRGSGVGANNFYLKPGKHTPEEIIKSVDKGLLLTQTLGQGMNPVTGDISLGAFGMWIEQGEIVYPVSEITISANLGKILNEIEMIGNDLDFRDRFAGPTLRFKEATIGGI